MVLSLNGYMEPNDECSINQEEFIDNPVQIEHIVLQFGQSTSPLRDTSSLRLAICTVTFSPRMRRTPYANGCVNRPPDLRRLRYLRE